MKRLLLLAVFLLPIPLFAQTSTPSAVKGNPKVRAITAFVRLDRGQWEHQVTEALSVLRRAEAEFKSAGYEVESVRITTQPVGELVAGLSEDDAVAFLARFDQMSAKENFIPNVGPVMMHDNDDQQVMRVAERALSTLPNIEASTII